MTTGVFVRVSGKVQGVNFRASTRREARKLGLSGWVRNTPDGDVELVIFAEPDAAQPLVDWCHRGPSRAVVSSVVDRPATEEEIRHSAGSGGAPKDSISEPPPSEFRVLR